MSARGDLRAELNEARRFLTRELVVGLLLRGWDARSLARQIGVSPGTILSWRDGATIARNDQRAELAQLGPRFWDRNTDPEEIRAAELAAGWDREP